MTLQINSLGAISLAALRVSGKVRFLALFLDKNRFLAYFSSLLSLRRLDGTFWEVVVAFGRPFDHTSVQPAIHAAAIAGLSSLPSGSG